MNFILKLAYLYKVTEKKRLIYMHLLLLLFVTGSGKKAILEQTTIVEI